MKTSHLKPNQRVIITRKDGSRPPRLGTFYAAMGVWLSFISMISSACAEKTTRE